MGAPWMLAVLVTVAATSVVLAAVAGRPVLALIDAAYWVAVAAVAMAGVRLLRGRR